MARANRAPGACQTYNFATKGWEDVGRTWTDPGFKQSADHPLYSRSAFRYGTVYSQAFNLVGFRVVRDIGAPRR